MPAASSTPSAGAQAKLMVGTAGSLGQVLTNGSGLTLYEFGSDHSTSTCYGACAVAWPPLLTKGTPMMGTGVQSKLVGTTTRKDGATQVTYAGHPLYRFAGDRKAGTAAGQGSTAFGGTWSALRADGTAAKQASASPSASPSSASPSGGGGGGGGY